VAWPLAARAQVAGRTYRLGVLMPFPRDHPFSMGFLTNCAAAALLKAKTSRSFTAILRHTLI
jgi:hypothetical protein